MIVYHGSNEIVVHPNIDHSRKSTDFSCGFYLTSLKQQAQMWALKKKVIYNEGFINQYYLDEEILSKLNTKIFNAYSLEWLEFISSCRLKKDKTNYDVVIGPIADDRIYDSLNLYYEGLIPSEEVINKIKLIKPNTQICIRNNEAINKLLKFEKAEAV